MAFNDFGDVFEVVDQNGEEPKSGMVAAITKVNTLLYYYQNFIKYILIS